MGALVPLCKPDRLKMGAKDPPGQGMRGDCRDPEHKNRQDELKTAWQPGKE